MISSFLYVWDVESDALQCFDFATGKGRDDLDEALASTQQQLTSSIKGLYCFGNTVQLTTFNKAIGNRVQKC